jgi:glycosyltransferase involved in cell wall biosynthesis
MNRDAPIAAIIAAYNARGTVEGVVRGVLRHLKTAIVVDDGSTDGTADAAREAGADVIVLQENHGKGNALRVLFTEARRRGFSAVLALDADGQHDPDDIPAFLQAHRAHPGAIIAGSRMGAHDQIPGHRRNSMLVARFFISLAANKFIEDTQCGFRVYPLSVIGSMALLKERYVTETELLIKAGDSAAEIRCLPIKALYPPGHSTHFRSVPDVAAISVYVISYLMVKWGIEAVRPGVINTYKGAGSSRDVYCLSPRFDRAFEVVTLLTCLPLTILYCFWYSVARLFSISVLYSLTNNGVPVGGLLRSVMLLPVLLLLSIIDLIGNRLRINPDLTTGFVRRHYADLWRHEVADSRTLP